MSDRPHGKYVHIDPDNPEALAICDYTGFVFHRKDLIRQMEWRGDRLLWTGFYVGRPFADAPNPQLRPPILPPDPVPVREPRLPQFSIQTWETIDDAVWQYQDTLWELWGGLQPEVSALPTFTTMRLTWDHQDETPWEATPVFWERWQGTRRAPGNPRRDALENVYFGAFS